MITQLDLAVIFSDLREISNWLSPEKTYFPLKKLFWVVRKMGLLFILGKGTTNVIDRAV